MSENIRVLNRMCDVGIALGVAKNHSQLLNRIRLQKFIYLLDVVSFLYQYLPPREGHLTYKQGPYDPSIQNAVDSLAFRGFVKVYNIERSGGEIHAEYGLSPAGVTWQQKLVSADGFTIRWQAALEIARWVNSVGWHRLRAMVYAEPTFVGARPHGFGQSIEPYDGLRNSAASLMEMINRGLRHGFEQTPPDRALIIQLFFRYLDSYSREHSP